LEKKLPATSDTGRVPTSKSSAKAARAPRLRRDGLLPIADGYLLRGVVESSFRGLCWFAGLFLAFALVTSARRVAQDGLPISMMIELISLQVWRIILFTIPASLLFGTMTTFSELSSRGEITALMAGGMSLWRMLRGPLAFAAVMGIFAFVLQEKIVPDAESRKDTIVKTAGSRIGIQTGFKIVDARSNGTIKRIIQADSFNPAELSLVKPVVQFFRADNTIEIEVQAQSGRWDPKRKAWIFQNGEIRAKPKSQGSNPTFDTRTQFTNWALETDASLLPGNLTTDKVTTADRLKKQNYEMVSIADLSHYRMQLLAQSQKEQGSIRQLTEKQIRGITFGIHDKFATPLVCLAMILIGAPMGIRPQRSANAGLAMGMSLMVLIFYYILWTLCTSWGKGGGAAPQFVAYLSFAITAGIGLTLVARKS
jgi:lipopolysaccharide export system permease protein